MDKFISQGQANLILGPRSQSTEHVTHAPIQDCRHLVDLLRRSHKRGAERNPVRVEAAEQAAVKRAPADLDAECEVVGKSFLRGAVAHELDSKEQPLATNVADD